MRRELVCLHPATPFAYEVRYTAPPKLRHDDVLIRVAAASVNPIDVKRSTGYGQRILGLKGAAHFPLVLGNDFAGHVEAIGPGVSGWKPGQAAFGLLSTSKHGGSHASLLAVPQSLLKPAPAGMSLQQLSVLPYSFTTLWLAVKATGLTASNACGKRVLLHGAAGGLGQLALQWLAPWGCELTAICSAAHAQACRELGAHRTVERGPQALQRLTADFDVVLNFANWDDELTLASRLAPNAMGQATTVHPLLGHFDRLGWIRGAMACHRDFRTAKTAARDRAPDARYGWTVFKPVPQALDALAQLVQTQRLVLPVGLGVDLDQAPAAFAHVASGQPGRAVLLS